MHGDVLLPDVEAGVVHTIAEQGALERRVVAEDHRKRVERKDVAELDDKIGHRVVGTVRIDAGLEPGPGVHQIDIGKRFRNLADHGIRSEEHTSELQSLMRISYDVFCLKTKKYIPA